MERWVLEGDSYSFLRSAPHTFNLQNRDGPNRVEIFDITTIPSHRSAISETTCLCDIFGDDGESPSLSSSPATATFLRREVDQSFSADDPNDSSGSYHTATDLSDTPSPKNIKDFSTSENRESGLPPIETTILSGFQNGLNPLDCTSPATKLNGDDISPTDNWAEPQVSLSTAPLNENKHSSGQQDINSKSEASIVGTTSLINPSKEPSDLLSKASDTLSSLEERQPLFFEQGGIIPSHTSASPILDSQGSIPFFNSSDYLLSPNICMAESSTEQNNEMFSENKEKIVSPDSMYYHSSQEENYLFEPGTINSGSPSELSNTSPSTCTYWPVQEMFTLPTNRDVFITPTSVTPELRATSTSPASRENSFTPELTGTSSLVSAPPTNDHLEMDVLTVTTTSTETRELMCSSTDARERLASPDINKICSSAPVHPSEPPEPVIINSPENYTFSPSPVNERMVCSTEPEASPSPPVITRIDYSDICSPTDYLVSAHSSEPAIIQSPVGDAISLSPINERMVCSAEPEASPSSPVITGIENSEICSSSGPSVSTNSPEPAMIHLPVGFTISPSPVNERMVYSSEPEASPSSPVIIGIQNSEICSSPDHSLSANSPKPAIIHSPVGCNLSPSPINERHVYSTEPEASPSSSVIIGIQNSEICSSPDQSVSAHSPESAIIHSPVGYSPSPINERSVYLTEPNALRSSPAITRIDYPTTPTYSRGCTPELRSITSTPNSRQNYLTPEPISPAPSLELRSVTCSPEITTITYNVLSQNPKSPVNEGLTYSVVSQNQVLEPEVEATVSGNSSETSNSPFINATSVSPTSKIYLSKLVNRSRSSSAASYHTRDTALFPDNEDQTPPNILSGFQTMLEPSKAKNIPSPVNCEGVIIPSPNPADNNLFDDISQTETFKSRTPALDEHADTGLQHLKIGKIQEFANDDTPDSNTCGTPAALSPCTTSVLMPVVPVEKKECHLGVYDSNSGTEMLRNNFTSSDDTLSQMPVAFRKSPRAVCRDNGEEYGRQSCREKEESGKRVGEKCVLGEGAETVGKSSYRGEQVELSFSARNRRGSAGHSKAPSSRDPTSGIPARCYFESHPTLQQQSHLRAQRSQQENKGGSKRVQSTVQGKYSRAGCPPECTGETSSMGSEFDEADNEVKWFTDLAFRSLSSPEVDYLDVYNSSHRSSTNVSQPSTMDSPGAVAWMTYADLRGSTLHENDDLSHSSSFIPRDGLDPTKRFEMGSFECVDVELESREETNKGKRTVPKRQIQLKRRNMDESKHKENTEHVLDIPSTNRHSKDTLVRQHSTPAFVPDEMSRGELDISENDRKKIFQKSASLDDASPKTQMASCIIKSVLSKKMQDVQKETLRSINPCPSGDKNKHPDISPSSFDVPSSIEKHSLSSSLHSECSLSSEDFAVREERSLHRQLKKCAPKVPPKPTFRPAFINTGEAEILGNVLIEEIVPKVAPPFENKVLAKQNSKSVGKEGGGDNLKERYNSNTANAGARNTSAAVATQAVSMQNRMTSRDTQWQMKPENQKQQGDKSVFMSKTPEITLKPSTIKEKKKSSLKVSLSPDVERSREMCDSLSVEKAAQDMSTKPGEVTETEENKSVIHKVRDVRKLVKNTYNLSFNPSSTSSTAEDELVQEKREKQPQTPPALHIECKAISWKDKQTSGTKATHRQGETQAVDKSKISQPRVATETNKDIDITEMTSKASSSKILFTESQQKVPDSQYTTLFRLDEHDKITERSTIHCDQSTKQGLPPRPPSKEREVSSLVVLQDGTSKTIKNTIDSTITDSTHVQATSNNHSVSMLLKEKGMQADIGVCDVLTEGAIVEAKHVNRLEVPLQPCLSGGISGEAQVSVENTAMPSKTGLVNSSLRTSCSQDSSRSKPEEQSENPCQITPTTTMTQSPTNLTTPGKAEVRSFSGNTKNNAMPVTASKEIELPIQVRSVSSDRLKPFIPPKPSYKQSFAEIRSISSDPPKADTQISSAIKQQTRLTTESKKNEIAATLIQDHSNEASSSNTKRLAVSAVSSYKPPPIPVTTIPGSVQKSTATTLTSVNQQQSSTVLQANNTRQQLTTLSSQDQSMPASSFASNPFVRPTVSQVHSHTQPVTRISSNNHFNTEDYHFYATDDPPSYDERESFSPLQLSDLHPQRPYRYQPTTKQSPCSCTPSSLSHPGHPHHSPQDQIPPASQSPGPGLSCPAAPPQAQVRPHQCRPDGQALNYPPVSPNTTIPQAPALIQPLYHSRAVPASSTQSCGDNQPPPSGPQMDRRLTNNRSPQVASGAPYHEYTHTANMSTLDPRPHMFNPQDLPPSFSHDYGSDGPGGAGVLYPENGSGLSCGQGPRRVLLDPETGKYFYIEVPMQPLRKMLFDPELGQYVEVLIPQQAMSHSGLYPPAAPPYSSLHNAGLYAPQYLPYAVPSYPAVPSGAQQLRHPEPPPVPTTLNQTSLRYGSPASQMPKSDPKGHSSLDQSYLESMYYIPTGMNASPNSTPSDCYRKPSPNMPPSGGRRA